MKYLLRVLLTTPPPPHSLLVGKITLFYTDLLREKIELRSAVFRGDKPLKAVVV